MNKTLTKIHGIKISNKTTDRGRSNTQKCSPQKDAFSFLGDTQGGGED